MVSVTASPTTGLPAGTYTVTYTRSSPAASGLTATLTVPSDGTGTFTATGLTSAGSATITITNIASTVGGCTSTISTGNVSNSITVNQTPIVSTSSSSICVGSTATILSPTTSGTWVSSNPAFATVANEGAVTGVAAGSVTFTFTTTEGCSATTSAVTVIAAPTATAGPNQTICSTGGALTGFSASNQSNITWTTSGTGTFSPASGTVNPTYTPSAADIAAGSVNVTLTAVATSPCAVNATTAPVTITIQKAPTATAGPNQTICGTGGTLTGFSAANQSNITWTTSGTGTFSPASGSASPTYNPSAADITAGSVNVRMTAVAFPPCAANAQTGLITITIQKAPTATAGSAQSICSSGAALTGFSATNQGTITWTTTGTGTFSPASGTVNPTYLPSAADIAAGSVNVTMTATAVSPCASNAVTAPVTITIRKQPTASAGGSQTICQSQTATVSGATAPDGTILWTHNGNGSLANATTLTPTYTPGTGDQNTTVTLLLTASNPPCANATATYTVIIQAPTANAGAALADICKGGISSPLGGSVGGTATGGTWSSNVPGGTFNPGATTLNATWTPPSTYTGTATLTLTTSGGSCGTTTASKTLFVDPNCQIITLTQPAIAVTVSAAKTNVSCNGAANGTITVSGVSAGATTMIQLNGSGADLSGQATFAAGTYVVTASAPNGNANGFCTATAPVTITEPVAVTVSAAATDVTCHGAANGIITISGLSAGATYIIQLNSTGTDLSGQATFGPGTYLITASAPNGNNNGVCTATTSVTIGEPTPLTASAVQVSPVVCNGQDNGSATVTPTGGNGGYLYSWDDGETTATATSLNGGLHTVNITDSKGCTTSATITINQPAALTAIASQDNPVACNGEDNGSATVTPTGGNGGYLYSWDDGETTATATSLNAGLHTVDITDSKGCTTSASVMIDEPPVLTATASQDNPVVCNGEDNGSATVTPTGGNGGYLYAWDDGETTATATGLNAGLHVVDITDSKGCTTSASVTINQPTVLTATAAQVSAVVCNGEDNGSATVTPAGGNGGYLYAWDDGESTATATGLNAGLHVVDITDSKGCTTSASVTINQPAALTAIASQDNPVACNGEDNGSATVTPTGGNGGYLFAWDDGESTATATGLNAGAHVVNITDSKGCTTSASVTIDQPVVLTASAVQDSPVACNGEDNGSATVTPTGGNGGYLYAWDDGEATATATGLNAGLHVVDITDSKGCTTSATVTISEPAVLAATAAQVSAVACNGGSNGSATVTPTGGNGGYLYSWDDGESTATATALNAGLHVVDITDSKGCITSATVTISEPTVLTATAVQVSPVACNGESNGSATVTPTGGNGGYLYSWDNGETTATATGLNAGLHVVDITDSKGCTTSASVTIGEPAVLTATAVQDNPVTCTGGSDGSATVTPTGGNGGYLYAWDNGETTATATGLNAGLHVVDITDSKGCTTSASVTIAVKPDPTISLSSAAGSDAQTLCIDNAINDITYAIGGTTTGAGVTGLPAGVTGSYSAGVFTISGTPTVSGTFNYSVTTSGPCVNPSLNGTITVNANSTISLSSAAGTDAQTVCIDFTIDDITYAIGGGATGASITAGALPAGVTGSYSAGVFTISGTPTESGTFNYTVTTTGPCIDASLSGTITVNANSTIILSSAAGTDGQTACIDNAIANITYAVGGGATGAGAAGLPAGVTGSYSAGVFTISGTPTVSGTFNYAVTTTGPCINPSLNGTITVNANSSIILSSAPASVAQTVCINNAITDITYAIDDGATGGGVTGLPTGVTGIYNAGVFTISGTPTVSGTFNYTVTTTGPCINPSLSGTITVNANSTITLSSAAGTDAQTVCINNAITAITYAIGGGATGASITAGALPAGVTGSYSAGVFTISGTPTVSGTFNYTVTTTGPCINVSLSGTITVNANSTISLSSASGTEAQTVCINNAITAITYAAGGGATGASITAGALPAGVTGSYSAGVFTISGTPTASGTFNYTVTTTGPCINPSLSGTITVNANSTITLSSAAGTAAQTVCINNAITAITYAAGGGATGASITAGALPAGVTGSYSAGVFTISGTPTVSGTFNYTVTTTGPCINPSLSGTITVNPSPVINAVSNATYCNNTAGAAIAFSSPTTGGTVTYSWTSTANAGFGTGGTGNISAYTATNNTNAALTATVTVTPTLNGCTGTATTFTITVNPSPTVNAVSNITYCNNTPGAAIIFSSPAGATVTYSWSSSVNVGFGLNGTGNISAFTATNNSFSPLTATVTVTPALNGCPGAPITFTVTINPNANAGTISGSSTLCPGITTQLSNNGIAGGIWTSGTPSVASVNPATGLVTGNTPGSATIVYTVTNICGASSAAFTVSVSSSSNAGTISGPTTVCVGSSVLLTTNGTTGGTWLSASPSATVNSSGFVTGVSQGTATIFYFISNSCGSSFTSYNVSVSPGANAGTITGSPSMCAGTVTQLFTTGSGGTWSSSAPAVAIVDANGFVLGLSPGTTTINYTVAANSCSSGSVAHFTLTVNPSGNAGTISGPTNVCVNASILLTTSGTSGGTWISGSPAATVNPFGLVTGVSSGSATIYYFVANTCGSSFATYNVNVSPAANAGTISGPSSVCTSSTISLSSSGTAGGIWSTNNAAIAIADVNGVVLGTGTGTATITYTVTSACATSSTSATVTVNAVANAGSVSGASAVCAGLSTTFTSSGAASGTWSSSNPAAATVNSTTGVVTGIAAGNSIITYAVTTVCGTATASAPLTVNPVLNAGTISGGSSVCNGSTINLSSNGNSGGSWTCSNPAVATVGAATGVVTSVVPGNTTITYTVSNGCGTSTATQLITVNAVANAGSVSGASSVCIGLSTTFTSNGAGGGTWSSSNTAAATVNSTTGVVTGIAARQFNHNLCC